MKQVAVLSLVALFAVHTPAAAPSASPATTPTSSTPTARLAEDRVTVTLDLREPLRPGRLVHDFAYSGSRSPVGGARVCDRADCPLPCPCSGPIAASSFDIDDRGRLWVVDSAKMRIAVFHHDSSLAFAVPQPGPQSAASYDLQVQGERTVVGHAGDGIYLIEGKRRSDLKPIESFGRDLYNSGTWFHVDETDEVRIPPTVPFPPARGGLFMDLDMIDRDPDTEFGRAEVYASFDLDHAEAREAHGDAPFRDGWLKVWMPSERPLVRLEARSSDRSWDVKIRARTIGGTGLWGYEYEVAENGTVHLLLRTGTLGLHSWWHLRVSADGEVGVPRHIYQHRSRTYAPTASDQLRHISLDSRGRPFVMWAKPKKTVVRKL